MDGAGHKTRLRTGHDCADSFLLLDHAYSASGWQFPRSRRRLYLVAIAFVLLGSAERSRAEEDARKTLIVTAKEATQSETRDSLELNGDLIIRSDSWRIKADSAVLAGALDEPDEISVNGAPAKFTYQREPQSAPISAVSDFINFHPDAQRLELDGDAYIEREGQQISSESIHYFLDDDLFKTGTQGRVRVVTQPGNEAD